MRQVRELREVRQRWGERFSLVPVLVGRTEEERLDHLEHCLKISPAAVNLLHSSETPQTPEGQPEVMAIYERCSDAGVPVILTISGPLSLELCRSGASGVAFIADSLPDLRIAISHGGWPMQQLYTSLLITHSNVHLMPDIYMNNPYAPGRDAFFEAIMFMNGRQMIFASGFPIVPVRESLGVVFDRLREMGASDQVLHRFFVENANHVFDLGFESADTDFGRRLAGAIT